MTSTADRFADMAVFVAPVLAQKYIKDLNKRAEGPCIENDWAKGAGYIPGVSTFTGALRVVKHTALLFHDIIAIPIVRALGRKEQDASQCAIGALKDTLKASAHNIANIFRGAVEMIPLVGNISVIGFDVVSIIASAMYKARQEAIQEQKEVPAC